MIKIRQFLLFLCIINIVIMSIVISPVFPENNSKFESVLSELKISIKSDNKDAIFNSIAKLKKLKSEMPLSLLLNEIKNTSREVSYRRILSDYTRYKIRYEGKNSFINNIPLFKEIIKDKNEQAMTRRNIISALTKGYILNELRKEEDISTIDIIPFLKDIINDNNEDPKVVAQAINSLSRMDYRGMNNNLLRILSKWEIGDPFLVKSTSENLGRQKNSEAIPILIEMANSSKSEDIFVTAIYSLGLTGNPEMIEPIINNYDRFGLMGRSICSITLKKNKHFLLKIIKDKKEEFFIPTIAALVKIKEKSAIPYLNELANRDRKYRNIIDEAIRQIED